MPKANGVHSTPWTTASEFLIAVNRPQISLMIRDPFVASAFRAAEDDGLAPLPVNADRPRSRWRCHSSEGPVLSRPLGRLSTKHFEATLVAAVDALAPIVRLNAACRPGSVRAKGGHIFRPKDSPIFRDKGIRIIRAEGIPTPFARVCFVVSGVVLGRRGRICHRRDNQSRAK
jgi:hypothetical protein